MTYNNSTKNKSCFVCGAMIKDKDIDYNKKTNLPVCPNCKGTDKEIKAELDALDSLSEGFVCGCI